MYYSNVVFFAINSFVNSGIIDTCVRKWTTGIVSRASVILNCQIKRILRVIYDWAELYLLFLILIYKYS